MRLFSDSRFSHAGDPSMPILKLRELEGLLREGDIVFTRIPGAAFRQIADATRTWTNHVGIVVGFNRFGAVIAESRVPIACRTLFSFFVRRSAQGRVAVLRPRQPLSNDDVKRLGGAVRRRLGRFYDTGFSLKSRRQFCSRFVREVLQESTGIVVGDIETLGDLLARNPDADLRLWKLWYFGRIPWERATVTPASLYESPALSVVFDGRLTGRGGSGAAISLWRRSRQRATCRSRSRTSPASTATTHIPQGPGPS
jgi:hypothetical protein